MRLYPVRDPQKSFLLKSGPPRLPCKSDFATINPILSPNLVAAGGLRFSKLDDIT